MAAADTKTKSSPAPKKEAPAPKAKDAPKVEAPKAETTKTEGGDTAPAAPKDYSRGEGQKPVTQAYKDNWNAIFAKKKTKKKR